MTSVHFCASPISSAANTRRAWDISLISIAFLVVMLFFSVGSQFSFVASDNTQLGATGGNLVYGSSDSALSILVQYGMIGCCLLLIWLHASRVRSRLFSHKTLTLLVSLSTISVIWSQDKRSTLTGQAALWLTYGVAMAFSYLPEDRQIEILEWTGGVATVASVITAIYYPQFGLNHRQNAGEWQGIFSGKNVCAMEVVFLIMPSLFRVGGGHRWFRWIYIISALIVIANTGSRTGWFLTIVLICWTVFIRTSGKLDHRGRMLFFACGPFFLTVLFGYFWIHRNVVFTLVGKDASLTGRTEIWQALWLSIMKSPLLGYGYRAFWEGMKGESANVMVHIGWVMGYAHNGFLGLWVELGAVGLAIFLISLMLAFRNGIFCILRDRSIGTYWYVTIVLYTILYNIDEATIMHRFQLTWMLYIVAWVGLARKRGEILSSQSSDQDTSLGLPCSVDSRS